MSQLETNTATIQNLIEKANSLPDAGSGGSGSVETCTLTTASNHSNSAHFFFTEYKDGVFSSKVVTQQTAGVLLSDCVVVGSCLTTIPSLMVYENCSNVPIALGSVGTYSINGNAIVGYYICFARNTLIILANGTTKPVQDITYEDELLVWDFDNGCYSSARPIWIKKSEISPYYYKCEFADGTILKLIGSNGNCHRVFNADTNSFEYANNCVGNHVMTRNGITTLLSCERIDEEVEFYNIITNRHLNLFAENVLTSCRLNNMYPITDMKFVKDSRELIPMDSFTDIDEEMYYGLRLGEQNIEKIVDLNAYIENVLMRKV